jgi:hypothetical protein
VQYFAYIAARLLFFGDDASSAQSSVQLAPVIEPG